LSDPTIDDGPDLQAPEGELIATYAFGLHESPSLLEALSRYHQLSP